MAAREEEPAGEVDTGIEELTEAIRKNPNDAEAYCRRARAYVRKGDYIKANDDFNDVVRIRDNIGLPRFSRRILDHVSYYNGDYDGAIADFTEAIRANPNDADAYFYRGKAYDRKGDSDKAVADFSESIRLERNIANHANCVNAYWFRGCIYFNARKDYDKAIADFTEAIALNHDNNRVEQLYMLRAGAYEAKGVRDKASADLEMALRIDPDCAEAKEMLERIKAGYLTSSDT